jgi:hypothetical protein
LSPSGLAAEVGEARSKLSHLLLQLKWEEHTANSHIFFCNTNGSGTQQTSSSFCSKSQFRRDPLGVLEALLWKTGKQLAISEHGARSCVYAEGEAVIHKHKAGPEEVKRQLDFYRAGKSGGYRINHVGCKYAVGYGGWARWLLLNNCWTSKEPISLGLLGLPRGYSSMLWAMVGEPFGSS